MKRVLIIGRRDVGEKNSPETLAAAIASQTDSVEIVSSYFEDVVVIAQNGRSEVLTYQEDKQEALAAFDTVIIINWSHQRLYTDLAHSIALVASRGGIRVWNSELITARSSTKLSQMVRMSFEGVSIPKTVFSLTPGLAKKHIDTLSTPFIAKNPLASRGRSNHLCSSWDDFMGQASEMTPYIFQEFVPNDASDLRMFVVAGEPMLAILRSSSGETHLNNISQGASAALLDLTDLPPKLIRDTVRVAKHFERELCGIDFMKSTTTNEYIFLEINTTPQIVNGAFVQEKTAAITQALTR